MEHNLEHPFHIETILLFSVRNTYGTTVFISKSGIDSIHCGELTNPCGTLLYYVTN